MVQDLIKQFLRKLLKFLPLFGIGLSLLMLIHSLWQLDLICVRPVWDTANWIPYFQSLGVMNFSDYFPFQCGFWFRTTVGNAYDYYLGMIVASWFTLLTSMYFYMYRLKKEIKKLRDDN